MKLTLSLPTVAVIASLTGCVKAGDFCEVAKPIMVASVEVADYLLDEDTQLSNSIIAHNSYGRDNCPTF